VEHGTREGSVVAPFLTQGLEGFNVDDEDDWERAERLVASGAARLPAIETRPAKPGSDDSH
jgi:CMP-N,N'-diacetyllegionaminic acid synthase